MNIDCVFVSLAGFFVSNSAEKVIKVDPPRILNVEGFLDVWSAVHVTSSPFPGGIGEAGNVRIRGMQK